MTGGQLHGPRRPHTRAAAASSGYGTVLLRSAWLGMPIAWSYLLRRSVPTSRSRVFSLAKSKVVDVCPMQPLSGGLGRTCLAEPDMFVGGLDARAALTRGEQCFPEASAGLRSYVARAVHIYGFDVADK